MKVRNMSTDSSSIKVIASFDMDELDGEIYTNTIDTILNFFPTYKLDNVYREVKGEIDIKKPADRYFYIEFTKNGCEPMRGLYSFMNFYLLGIVVAVGKIFVLQQNDFGVPDDLLEGKEKVPVNCGIGYTTIPIEVMYSHDDLCDAVKALSMGFKEGKRTWFVNSVARIIGMTAESARNQEMCAFVKCVLDCKERLLYAYPSSRIMLMIKNWSKMSMFVRSADDKDKLELGEGCVFTKNEMSSVLSLLNRSKDKKDGKENAAAGWPTAAEETDLYPKSFLSDPTLSTLQQQTSIRGCLSILELSDSSPRLRSSSSRFSRGMCTPSFSSHTFGRGMCASSVFPSPAVMRGWPTAAEETDLYPKSFLSDPTLSTSQQQTSIRGCPSILELSDSSWPTAAEETDLYPKSFLSDPTLSTSQQQTSIRGCPSILELSDSSPRLRSSSSRFSRGMCTPSFSSHTFGRGMCDSSVFPSPAVMRGWPTAVGLTDLHPRAFLSGPMLSTWQQTSVRGCSSILERSSPSCKDGIYSASRQMFRIMRSVFRR